MALSVFSAKLSTGNNKNNSWKFTCLFQISNFYYLVLGVEDDKKQEAFVFPKFVVMGHRGFGMNMLQSPDEKMKSIKENSILSFNVAADFPIDFVEFDVQVWVFA